MGQLNQRTDPTRRTATSVPRLNTADKSENRTAARPCDSREAQAAAATPAIAKIITVVGRIARWFPRVPVPIHPFPMARSGGFRQRRRRPRLQSRARSTYAITKTVQASTVPPRFKTIPVSMGRRRSAGPERDHSYGVRPETWACVSRLASPIAAP